MSATTPDARSAASDVRAGGGSPGSRSYTAAMLGARALRGLPPADGGSSSSIAALGITNAALPLALVAVGETFVILTNGIDLSVGAILTLRTSRVACAHDPRPRHAGIVLALAIGAAAGLANGLIVSYLRIAPLIATLATSSIFFGFAAS